MNHCFQSLTASFFFSIFLFSCLLSLSFYPSLPFLPTLRFPFSLSSSSFFSRLSFVLSGFVRLSHTSPGTKVEGNVFMIVNISMVLSSAWFCSPSCPKGNKACFFLFFCNSKQIQICRLLFPYDGGGSSVIQDECEHA